MNTILLCLALTVFHEARGEPIEGQRAVAAVVMNRTRIRQMHVCEVLLQKGQFSWHPEKYIKREGTLPRYLYYIDQSALPTKERGWKESLEAARYVLNHGSTMPDIEYFHASHLRIRWEVRYIRVATIGRHVFYARKGPPVARKMVKMGLSVGILG